MKQLNNTMPIKPINMTCICCPLGCNLSINKLDTRYIITGNRCLRGRKYAIEEVAAPKRIITSTVKIINGLYPVIPVKTDRPAPKEKIFTIMRILASVTVRSPIQAGDIVVENIADTGISIVVTKTDSGKK